MRDRTGRVLASVGAVAALFSTLLVGASPVSADRGGVTEILTVAETDYGPLLVSGDLSTLVRSTDFGSSLVATDLSSGTEETVVLPDGSPSSYLAGISDDGSTLALSGNWEGVVDGDADGGFDDGFLLDLGSAELDLLTGTVADSVNGVLALDGTASRAVLVSYPLFDGPFPSYSLWEDGAITPLAMPDALYGGTLQLSADGSTLLYALNIGSSLALYARDLGTGDEQVVAGGYGYGYYDYGFPGYGGYAMSDDGAVVAWLDFVGPPNQFGERQGVVRIWDTSGTAVETHTLGDRGANGPIVLSGDGATVSGVSYTVVDHDTYEVESSLWQLDLASGTVESLYTDPNSYGGGNLAILGVNDDGTEIIFSGQSEGGFPEPFEVSQPDEYYYYRVSVFRWSADGTPAPNEAVAGFQPSLADQIGRLYEAYFGRAPDAGGLAHWINERANGTSLAAVSQAFALSPEFNETYGSLDDTAFVTLVYQNVLDRAPDASGLAYWLDQLAAGASRGSIMVGFSESPEFVVATATSAPMSTLEGSLRRMYWVFLGRAASDADLAYWTEQVANGGSLTAVADAMASTDEYAARFGGLEFWYVFEIGIMAALGRYPEEADYQRWGQALENGTLSIPQFLLELANEPEVVVITGTTPPGG